MVLTHTELSGVNGVDKRVLHTLCNLRLSRAIPLRIYRQGTLCLLRLRNDVVGLACGASRPETIPNVFL